MPSVWRSADMVDAPGAMNKGSSVPEIKPLDQYDFNRAKICASVRWLLSKSYGSAGTTVRGAVWVGRLIIHALHTEIEADLCHIQWIFQRLNTRHLASVMLVANLLYPALCAQLLTLHDEPIIGMVARMVRRNLLRAAKYMTETVSAAVQQSLLSEIGSSARPPYEPQGRSCRLGLNGMQGGSRRDVWAV